MKKRLLAVIISAMIISTSMLAGCGCENKTATADEAPTTVSETHEVSDTSSPSATEATLSKEEQAIVNSGLKVDDKGNVVDKNGKKVEVKDGKVEIKTEDGKTVTVNASEVSTANKNNSKINTSTSSKSNSASSKSSLTGSSSSKNNSSSKMSSSSSKSNSTSSKSPSSFSGSSSKQESSTVKETKHTHSWVNITKPAKVIDQEATTKTEDVYEERECQFCKGCGINLTTTFGSFDSLEFEQHVSNHIKNGEPSGWYSDWQNVKVGTKTVNVPEKSHFEIQNIGRKCSSCGKTEYY